MPYFLIIPNKLPNTPLFFDHFLGSAFSVAFYWETAGRELNLPIISSLTERADSEKGLTLSSDDLLLFRNELNIFENHWITKSSHMELPDGFIRGIREINIAINVAISNKLTLMVC